MTGISIRRFDRRVEYKASRAEVYRLIFMLRSYRRLVVEQPSPANAESDARHLANLVCKLRNAWAQYRTMQADYREWQKKGRTDADH